jgi:hypothetical protein
MFVLCRDYLRRKPEDASEISSEELVSEVWAKLLEGSRCLILMTQRRGAIRSCRVAYSNPVTNHASKEAVMVTATANVSLGGSRE